MVRRFRMPARHAVGMSEDEREPIEQVLPGFRLHPLEESWTPLQAFVMVKCLDEAGQATWSFRTSEPLNLEELLGALTVQTELLKRRLLDEWDSD
jgi:hypothetical protein